MQNSQIYNLKTFNHFSVINVDRIVELLLSGHWKHYTNIRLKLIYFINKFYSLDYNKIIW